MLKTLKDSELRWLTKDGAGEFLTLLKDEYGISLNSQQRQAAGHISGPALVLVGPGSGKQQLSL